MEANAVAAAVRRLVAWHLGYPLVNIQKTMENHHAINGKTHYFDWAIFNSYVKLPEGKARGQILSQKKRSGFHHIKITISMGFLSPFLHFLIFSWDVPMVESDVARKKTGPCKDGPSQGAKTSSLFSFVFLLGMLLERLNMITLW